MRRSDTGLFQRVEYIRFRQHRFRVRQRFLVPRTPPRIVVELRIELPGDYGFITGEKGPGLNTIGARLCNCPYNYACTIRSIVRVDYECVFPGVNYLEKRSVAESDIRGVERRLTAEYPCEQESRRMFKAVPANRRIDIRNERGHCR